MFVQKQLRSAMVLLVLAGVFGLGVAGGYFAGTGRLEFTFNLANVVANFGVSGLASEPEPLIEVGPRPLWVSGSRLMTPPGTRVELRVADLPANANEDAARAALLPGVTAVRVSTTTGAYLADPAERQRVAANVNVIAEWGAYPLIAAESSSGECGLATEQRTQFWAAVAGDMARWPSAAFDLGAAGCPGSWPETQALAAGEIDTVRQVVPDVLTLVETPAGMTPTELAASLVPREGVLYRVPVPEPGPRDVAQPPQLAGLPVLLELPPLLEGRDAVLRARIAMSDIVAAQPAGWRAPSGDGPALRAVADAALRGAQRVSGDGAGGLPRIRVAGNRLVDPSGKAVRLYGFNRPGMEVFLDLHHAPSTADLDEMARRGANLLRLPVNPVWYRTQPDYRATALRTIAAAEGRGIYTLLDLHWSTPEGVAVCHPEMATATRFWQEAAFDLRGNTSVIFDIYNEPCQTTWQQWRPLAEQMIDAIRAVDAAALVMVPGVDWAYDLRGVADAPVRRENVVYNAHDYPWKMYLDREQAYGYLADRYPVFIGEFGADYQPRYGFYQDPVAFTGALLDYAERRGLVGWAAWAWHADITPNMFMDAQFTPTPFGRAVLDRLAAAVALLATLPPPAGEQ